MRAAQDITDTIKVFVPTGKAPATDKLTHRRAKDSQCSLVVGLLDNHKHNTGKVLDRLEERLREHYGDVRFIRAKKLDAGKGAAKKIIEQLAAECQAVITGISD